MRPPGLALLLMLWGGSRLVEAAQPLNLFRPDTGQRTTFELRREPGPIVTDTVSYRVTARSGDTANVHILYLPSQRAGSQALVWSQGKLTAGALLMSRTLDTNGIYSRLKTFPADYTLRTATNRSGSGYTLQHVVDGYIFDTLLVACQYLAATDAGDNCDFITPSGVLVYSNVINWTRYRLMPDAKTLAAMGGRPVPNPVPRNSRRMSQPASSALWLTKGFDIRGRWSQALPAGAGLPVPGK